MEIEIIDNSPKIKAELQVAVLRTLETCGQRAEDIAALLVTVDTGNLRDSITHKVYEVESAVYIGTNTEYGPYVELGTGKYYHGGRPTPWAYQDSKGEWHWTAGNKAKPFLKPAVADHVQTYKKIIEDELKNR